jgi:hypothetical protein
MVIKTVRIVLLDITADLCSVFFYCKWDFYLFIYFISFIHMCIQCLGNFSLPTPSLPGRNYYALISNFFEERV